VEFVKDGRRALTLALIDELHAILMQDDDAAHPGGAYREHQAWIGSVARIEDATFVPAPPAEIAGCMTEMAAGILQYAPREDECAISCDGYHLISSVGYHLIS